jgi:UDP-glucose 4-epimerase
MKSLVTGCAGFIGSHLAERLLGEGHEVVGIDNFSDYYSREIKEKNIERLLNSQKFKLIEADINTLDLKKVMEGVDYVFHQAAQAGVRASWGGNFRIYTDSNILATQALLEAAKDSNIKKFVYASSSSIYGDVDSLPMRESDVPRPVSPYGVSKLAGEHLCYLYWKNFRVPTIALRYFTVYGERQRPDMAFHRFIKAILAGGEIVVYGDGEQTRDFTYVADIVEANILAAEYKKSGKVFNIGGGNRISINRVIELLEELTGLKARVKYVETQKGDVRDTYADISLAREELGFEPRTDIKEGLRREIEWIKSCYGL